MDIKKGNSKLIDYVLDELDEQDRQIVEQAIENDEAVRQAVEEIRAAVTVSAEALGAGTSPGLTDEQRAAIFAEAEDKASVSKKTRWFGLKGLAAAAVLVLMVGVGTALMSNLGIVGMKGEPETSSLMLAELEEENLQAQRRIKEIRELPREQAGAPVSTVDVELMAGRDAYGGGYRADYGGGNVGNQSLSPPRAAPMPSPPVVVNRNAKPKASVSKGRKALESYRGDGGYGGDSGQISNMSTRFNLEGGRVFGDSSDADNRRSIVRGSIVAPPASSKPSSGIPDDPNEVYWPGHNTEEYDSLVDNPFMEVVQSPLSTFSIDVDTASYSNMRRFLNQNAMPPASSVRIEELVNYFSYDYELPDGDDPFSANVEVATCPWDTDHRLVRIGLKGWEIEKDDRPASNLVFLIDVSGSMRPTNKLPLLQKSMRLLVDQLDERDCVAIAVYAGASGLVLPSTSADKKEAIIASLDRLKSGGSTNGGAGIQLAYDVAVQNYIKGGVNRVILATDGDFNVGTTSQGELVNLIEEKAKSGVFLSVLGFGMGNLNDSTLEKLADKGNGNYAYIDTLNEGRKVLVEEMGGTLITIAKDVKIQVDFNSAEVAAYRLIGYENRMLRAEDFNDDTKDAGEIGAGHTVTALYEVVPAGQEIDTPSVDPSKYQRPTELSDAAFTGQMMTLRLRYKQPDGDTSKKLEFDIVDEGTRFDNATEDFKFAASVAAFGMILRDSEHKGGATFDTVLELAEDGVGDDDHGYRREFVSLVEKAKKIR